MAKVGTRRKGVSNSPQRALLHLRADRSGASVLGKGPNRQSIEGLEGHCPTGIVRQALSDSPGSRAFPTGRSWGRKPPGAGSVEAENEVGEKSSPRHGRRFHGRRFYGGGRGAGRGYGERYRS